MNQVEAMKAFCAVYQAGTFAKASQQLNTSTTMISRYVKQLEDHLGCLLLKRNTRQVNVTAAGETYYEKASDILAELVKSDSLMQQFAKEPAGRLAISSSIEFGGQYLAEPIAQFSQLYPKVSLDLQLSNEPVDIWQENIDLALRVAPKLSSASFIARPIASSRLSLWASEYYLQLNGLPTEPEQLSQHQLLFFSHSLRQEQWIFSATKHSSNEVIERKLPWSFKSNNGRLLNEMAAIGHGIIQAPFYSVASYVQAGQLVEIMPEYAIENLAISAVYPHNSRYSLALKMFVEFISDYFNDQPLP